MEGDTAHHSETSGWNYFLAYKASRSHALMAWCGVAIFPLFGVLDYIILEEWQLFLAVRVVGAILVLAMLLCRERLNLSYLFIAHFSCHVVLISLMWMLSQMHTPEQFYIYALNASTGFIASSIFLLWPARHSVILLTTNAIAFILFFAFFSTLSTRDILSHGVLLLFTIVVMTQLYINYKYNSTLRDFNRQLELNHAYEELKLRNFEINQRNHEILHQKARLEKLNELKDRLFMIISHDFRSPLHSLKGLIVLLNDHEFVSPEEFKTLLRGLRQNVDQTYDLLENLLIWAKSQMKGARMKPERLQLSDLIGQNIALLRAMAENKDIRMHHEVGDTIVVCADADMIRLVIRNLITNAIKFTGSPGEICVKAVDNADHVVIAVQDNGIGMDEEKRAHIFGGIQNSSSGTRKEKGTGLGLMLCKEFVEKNGGSMWMESEPGKGSTFYFTLPSAEPQKKFA